MAIRFHRNNDYVKAKKVIAKGMNITKVFTGSGKKVFPDGESMFKATPETLNIWPVNTTQTKQFSIVSMSDGEDVPYEEGVHDGIDRLNMKLSLVDKKSNLWSIECQSLQKNGGDEATLHFIRDLEPKNLYVKILVHDSYGSFKIKSGVDTNHDLIFYGDLGSHDFTFTIESLDEDGNTLGFEVEMNDYDSNAYVNDIPSVHRANDKVILHIPEREELDEYNGTACIFTITQNDTLNEIIVGILVQIDKDTPPN